MIIQTENTQGTGLGDLVLCSWISEANKRLSYNAKGSKAELLRLLGQSITENEPTQTLEHCYRADLANGQEAARIKTWANMLGCSKWKQPAANIPEQSRQWGEQFRGSILLFPQSQKTTREWPASYWLDLAWCLHHLGRKPAFFMANKDHRYTNSPSFYFGYSLADVSAAMKACKLVVANDSMPAHLAGTLSVKTLALLGPTLATVFSHCETVTTMASNLDCTGCHFGKPFRAACDQGCMSLMRLYVEGVLDAIIKRT